MDAQAILKSFFNTEGHSSRAEGRKMKSRSGIICLPYAFSFPCFSFRVHTRIELMGTGTMGAWKQAGTTESRTIHINSKPEVARVYINDTLAGDTPMALSLPLPY